jgi:hypothetical protein
MRTPPVGVNERLSLMRAHYGQALVTFFRYRER